MGCESDDAVDALAIVLQLAALDQSLEVMPGVNGGAVLADDDVELLAGEALGKHCLNDDKNTIHMK